MKSFILIIIMLVLLTAGAGAQQNTRITGIGDSGSDVDVKLECLSCHSTTTPYLVDQWRGSKHALDNVKCNVCHGAKISEDFIAKPLKERCRACHPDQVMTLSESKMSRVACGDCHSVHQFSSKTARETMTCTGCHTIQWEFYNGSAMEKKGVRCSDCHFHKDYSGISNHSLKVETETCAGCHNNTMMEQVGIIKSEVAGLLLEAKKDASKKAVISLIENDSSMGFHNPKKAREMLRVPSKISGKGALRFFAGFSIIFLAILLLSLIKKQRDKR